MLSKYSHVGYQSTLIQKIPGIFHAYSTRRHGDMRQDAVKRRYVQSMKLSESSLVWPEQIHGVEIGEVTGNMKGHVPGVDGLTYHYQKGAYPVLAVHTADCVPLLFVDPVRMYIAVAHAGWRGTLGNISQTVVNAWKKSGSSVDDIYVSIGLHICVDCYDVPEERVQAFRQSLGNDPRLSRKKGDAWHLDIGYANRLQLLSLGVVASHIDMGTVCTSCEINDFFSYRKNTKETFGETIGVIGFLRT